MSELVRLAKEALRQQQALDPIPTIQAGDRITWGTDGTLRGPATVDFLHTDPDGTGWAFCSVADSWVAVNIKYLTHVEPGEKHVEAAN
jgi:hypothetical protein